jgi:hypothetical protein
MNMVPAQADTEKCLKKRSGLFSQQFEPIIRCCSESPNRGQCILTLLFLLCQTLHDQSFNKRERLANKSNTKFSITLDHYKEKH